MASNPFALGSESPIVGEVSFTGGSGPVGLAGALGNFFQFSDVLDDGMCVAVTVTDDSGQKEAFFAKFQNNPPILIPIVMIISSNNNQKIVWADTGQRIVKLMLGVLPATNAVPIPGAPTICDVIQGACLCPAPQTTPISVPPPPTPPPPAPPPPPNMLVVDQAILQSYFDSSTQVRTLDLVTTHPNEVAVVKILVQAEGGAAASISSVTTSGLSWAPLFTATGPGDGYGGGSTFIVSTAYSTVIPTPGTYTIKITGNSNTAFVEALAFGVTGGDLVTPWDTNPSLPALAQANTTSFGSVTNVSTDNANDMLLFFYDMFGLVRDPNIPVGFTEIGAVGGVQAFIGLSNQDNVSYKTVSAKLVSTTISGAVDPIFSAGYPAWMAAVHAIRAAGSP